MSTFAILTPPDNPQLASFVAAMNRVFPNGTYRFIAQGQYLAVKQGATSQQISNELGPSGEAGKFIVLTSGGYWGWYDKPVWEWLTAMEAG